MYIMSINSKIISMTQDLVRIPSESSEQTATNQACPEKGLLEYLARICKKSGITYQLQEAMAGRSNFIAHFPGNPDARLLIMAHMDTVSAKGMDGPFSGRIDKEKIWGRGSCDDKGPMAVALTTLLDLHRRRQNLAYDVTFAATIDEECSMSGSTALAQLPEKWDLCIGLEPTGLNIVKAHKGVYRCRITTKGLAAHSSAPQQGRNAITGMYEIMRDLKLLEFRLGRERHH